MRKPAPEWPVWKRPPGERPRPRAPPVRSGPKGRNQTTRARTTGLKGVRSLPGRGLPGWCAAPARRCATGLMGCAPGRRPGDEGCGDVGTEPGDGNADRGDRVSERLDPALGGDATVMNRIDATAAASTCWTSALSSSRGSSGSCRPRSESADCSVRRRCQSSMWRASRRRTTTVAYRNTVSRSENADGRSELRDEGVRRTVRMVAVLSWGLKRGGGPHIGDGGPADPGGPYQTLQIRVNVWDATIPHLSTPDRTRRCEAAPAIMKISGGRSGSGDCARLTP